MAGKSSFSAWQERQMAAREALIKEFLNQCKKSKANYPGITALADVIAKHIAKIEDKPCSTPTILRNPRYKSFLTHYLANQRGAKHIGDEALPDDRARALVTSLKLELLNVRKDNERLQRYIDVLDKQAEPTPALFGGANAGTESLKQVENDLARSCMTLHKVLSKFEDLIGVDTDNKQIVDLSIRKGRPGRVVADEGDAAPYFAWLRRNVGA